MMLPGIKINTGGDDFFPIEQMQLMRFNGEGWELFGDIITGEVGHESEAERATARSSYLIRGRKFRFPQKNAS